MTTSALPFMPGPPGMDDGDAAWITSVVVDCADPQMLARFWSELLGLPVQPREGRYVTLARPRHGVPELVFQPVPEPKIGKVRIHLDVGVHDLDGMRRRALTLGATDGPASDDPDDVGLAVLLDPEGNEFCLIRRGPSEV